MRSLNVLVACEESQAVCSAFRKRGHRAFSCDLQACSGGHPEWHIVGDVLPILNGSTSFTTCDGQRHTVEDAWDILIAHPPCTYLTVTGNVWFNVEKYGDRARKRLELREEALNFFMEFTRTTCAHVAIENPVGIVSTRYRRPDQIIQPYEFGDPFEKRTCLWLFGLPKLTPTNVVTPPPRVCMRGGHTMAAWYAYTVGLPADERSRVRSKTFPGIADAIAEQFSTYVLNTNL